MPAGIASENGGVDAIAEAQQAARESLLARQKPETLTERYISEEEYVGMFEAVS